MSEHDPLKLHDVVRIQAMKSAYCFASDIAQTGPGAVGTLLDDLFTEDVTADYGFGPVTGREALLGYLTTESSKHMQALWHAIHSPHITVTGDTADAWWTVIVRMKPQGASEWGIVYGRYHDRFRRTAQGWRISQIQWVGDDLGAELK